MASEQSCRVMASRIKTILIHGIAADKKTQQYIASVFLSPGPEMLRKILHDETDSDRDSLLDLIFTPDETAQCQLEALIEAGNFDSGDEKRICRIIGMESAKSCLILPNERISISLPLTPAIILAYVSRLKLTRTLPLKLIAVINQRFDKAVALQVKVTLRNSGLRFTGAQIDFLSKFFKVLSSDKKFQDHFNFMIPILESLPANKTIRKALQDQRKQYINHIDQAAQFKKMLEKGNMETLMLRGIRTPYISEAQTLAKIAAIDDICYSIWTKKENFETKLNQ